MPFDGIVVKSIVNELSETLVGGRIDKVFQPERDEIILTIRAKGENVKLLLSASAVHPRIHLSNVSKENPQTPPVFCMLLRKHLVGGRILGVDFYDFERIVSLQVESVNELGDLTVKKFIIEIMGRHSNIILVNHEDIILDSIKHVDKDISSVREIMPARDYVLPPAQDKTSPESIDTNKFLAPLGEEGAMSIEKYLLHHIKGFSPLLCREVCSRSRVNGKKTLSSLHPEELQQIKEHLVKIIEDIKASNFTPCIAFENKTTPIDFHCLQMTQYSNITYAPSISSILDTFFAAKDTAERLKQKRSDISKLLNNNIDRVNKKLALHHQKLRDVSNRDQWQLFGELIIANIYSIPKNAKTVSLQNYYSETNECVDIPLDENLTPQENAQHYFRKYTKAKTAYEYINEQLDEASKELDYLESVQHLLETCTTVHEIDEVRQELADQGYLTIKRRKNPAKRQDKASLPLHFQSTDGFDIFVGKNNKQNDYLTLKLASSNDIWLHTRNIPGSHVIVKKNQQDVPDTTLLEAALLAAYHSKAKLSSNVPVDFTEVKYVKKPHGAKPGMVIYDNFKTLVVTPVEDVVNKLSVNQ